MTAFWKLIRSTLPPLGGTELPQTRCGEDRDWGRRDRPFVPFERGNSGRMGG